MKIARALPEHAAEGGRATFTGGKRLIGSMGILPMLLPMRLPRRHYLMMTIFPTCVPSLESTR